MKYGSLFSGIGGFDLGFDRAGMECAWQVEIDRYARSVLQRHWPDVQKFEDVRHVGRKNLDPVDLICGGFPCQDLSVAGNRAGLAGERSGLWFEFHRILSELRPEWVVIENVPGLLSSWSGDEPPCDLEEGQEWETTETSDFLIVIRGLVELGYGVAWRILDAQHFGVPQRRRRVFIVGHLGDGRAAQVLFESESGAWDSAPRREEGGRVAALTQNGVGTTGADDNQAQAGHLIAFQSKASAQSSMNLGDIVPSLDVGKAGGACVAFGGNNTQGPIGLAATCNAHVQRYDFESETFVAFAPGNLVRRAGENPSRSAFGTLGAEKLGDMFPHVASQSFGVRRLTPTETERLQGFPDGWTEGQSDSQRYKQCGNAVNVKVAEWLGRRIVEAAK